MVGFAKVIGGILVTIGIILMVVGILLTLSGISYLLDTPQNTGIGSIFEVLMEIAVFRTGLGIAFASLFPTSLGLILILLARITDSTESSHQALMLMNVPEKMRRQVAEINKLD